MAVNNDNWQNSIGIRTKKMTEIVIIFFWKSIQMIAWIVLFMFKQKMN